MAEVEGKPQDAVNRREELIGTYARCVEDRYAMVCEECPLSGLLQVELPVALGSVGGTFCIGISPCMLFSSVLHSVEVALEGKVRE